MNCDTDNSHLWGYRGKLLYVRQVLWFGGYEVDFLQHPYSHQWSGVPRDDWFLRGEYSRDTETGERRP